MSKLVVKQTDPEIGTEIIASSIEAISAGLKRMRAGR